MFNRETILKNLNTENYYIDNHSLDLFLEDWKIESIYEDEDGLEFYDDLALEKIKKGISLKAQGYSDEQIIAKLSRMEAKIEKNEEPAKPVQPLIVSDLLEENTAASTDVAVKEETQTEIIPQGKSFTLDVSSQTLQMLAEAVAKKISDDITNSDMATRLIEAGGYKRDNEILAKQVHELLEHNKELSKRIEQLESHESKNFWSRFWGKH
ncbi:TPA: hypothetical protein CPT90_00940 [Candidatus Gastranaerophilales bacterium HUM_3]|jgi:hypothetical protein|nr:hypothetical protein [Acinetobacter sp.]OLA72655.1 MAG: hypothetical protein BHW62_09545 [Acinetobacter sp. CAG:196_36_41]DAA85493.1 MAG TPA: hypothetical protein CPT99_09195 [Candidatus Gastranaerophilales bacterium HUM_4]DAA87463.1 MAG TPA: hypothetical protein CPT90_00940 [Candidatus Gastranaerophilales bacterium HUM_3]DAA88206.1 MAG TPA: hypothetical protein CPT87_11140 [Candidatus Gastranaerophilales bacterium HUM_5]DAA98513.1 MAG TPA: hypothetical protein CPT88_01250 [Candidatus Gastr